MIAIAEKKFSSERNILFSTESISSLAGSFDFVVASGIFNVKQDVKVPQWIDYVFQTLEELFKKSGKVMVFDGLHHYTSWPPEKLGTHLYYADPGLILDYCMKHFSRNCVMDLSSTLWEYTMTIFKSR